MTHKSCTTASLDWEELGKSSTMIALKMSFKELSIVNEVVRYEEVVERGHTEPQGVFLLACCLLEYPCVQARLMRVRFSGTSEVSSTDDEMTKKEMGNEDRAQSGPKMQMSEFIIIAGSSGNI